MEPFAATTLATIIPISGALCWAAITWVYLSVFTTLDALAYPVPGNPPDMSILGPSFKATHISYSNLSAWLSFLLVLAVWRLWPRLEQRSDNSSVTRGMKWATIAVAFVVMATASARGASYGTSSRWSSPEKPALLRYRDKRRRAAPLPGRHD